MKGRRTRTKRQRDNAVDQGYCFLRTFFRFWTKGERLCNFLNTLSQGGEASSRNANDNQSIDGISKSHSVFVFVCIILISDLIKANASIRSKYTAFSFIRTLIIVKSLDPKENCTFRKISSYDQRGLRF